MSRIYFHSPSGELEIYGRERALMGLMCDRVAFATLLGCGGPLYKWVPRLLNPGEFPLRALDDPVGCSPRFDESLGLWCRHGSKFMVDGEDYDAWQMSLNTIMAIGNDPLKLYARLHAQCEIYAFVEGPNRAWLAGIIRQGVACGLYRDGGYPPSEGNGPIHGEGQWTKLAEWLESRPDEPVVTSYSVCEQFPNRHVARWKDDEDGDRWHGLDWDRQWAMAMDGLRSGEVYGGTELTPDDWVSFRFGHEKDFFWLADQGANHA